MERLVTRNERSRSPCTHQSFLDPARGPRWAFSKLVGLQKGCHNASVPFANKFAPKMFSHLLGFKFGWIDHFRARYMQPPPNSLRPSRISRGTLWSSSTWPRHTRRLELSRTRWRVWRSHSEDTMMDGVAYPPIRREHECNRDVTAVEKKDALLVVPHDLRSLPFQ